jgi:hypothetical protein
MKKSKLSVITTLNHNIGDDFVREGIIYLFKSLGNELSIECIHKHSPITNYYSFSSIKNLNISNYLYPLAKYFKLNNRIADSNIIIQSGAPIYWCNNDIDIHCCTNEWYGPLIRDSREDIKSKLFLNIAGGSCQPYHSSGQELIQCSKCRSYIAELYDASDLTLLRDSLAKDMLNISGRDATVLPCTSIFARDVFGIVPGDSEYIVLNYMENAGHYVFNQDIDKILWEQQFISMAHKVSKMGRVIISCHSKNEENWAKRNLPNFERFLVPNDHEEFIKFYSHAKWGVLNRVHGAFMMASFGKPAVIIGNDSRARMISMLNLESHYVGDLSEESIDNIIENVRARSSSYIDESIEIRERTLISYLDEINKIL